MSTGTATSQATGRARSRRRTPAILLGVAAVVAVTAVAWACRASSANAGGSSVAQAPADTLVTTLGPSGFAPNQLSHAAGRFNLKVTNQSGEREVTLRLSDADGQKVSEAKLTDKVKEWSAPVELTAGTYTLSEANHTDWTCRVEVTAQ